MLHHHLNEYIQNCIVSRFRQKN